MERRRSLSLSEHRSLAWKCWISLSSDQPKHLHDLPTIREQKKRSTALFFLPVFSSKGSQSIEDGSISSRCCKKLKNRPSYGMGQKTWIYEAKLFLLQQIQKKKNTYFCWKRSFQMENEIKKLCLKIWETSRPKKINSDLILMRRFVEKNFSGDLKKKKKKTAKEIPLWRDFAACGDELKDVGCCRSGRKKEGSFGLWLPKMNDFCFEEENFRSKMGF